MSNTFSIHRVNKHHFQCLHCRLSQQETVLSITELPYLTVSWGVVSIGMFPLNATNSCSASTSFSSSSSDASFLTSSPSRSSVPAMFFPFFILYGGIIEVISSLTVFGRGFAIISVRKLVIDLPLRPNILSLTR